MSMAIRTAFHILGRRLTPWWSIDWSRQQRWVRVQERWANVVEIGPPDGEPVLFLHGLGGSWRNWLENLPVIAEAGYRAIAVDLPGFGHSEMPADKVSIPGYGRWVDELCGQLGISAAAVVGNSMGGFIGAELAIQSPSRVERLVLVSAAGISAANLRVDSALQLLYKTEAIGTYMTGLVLARAAALVRRPRLRWAAMALVMRHPERLSPQLAYEQITGMGTPGF